ncbi:MAG: hypothetical protein Q8L26_08405 [Candidatus Omnitrophota bacterium]|nr:hypothetical protein [Candidatus Omnitrophota bacterium]
MNIMEKFIRDQAFLSDMAKDSDLVKEVEKFLSSHNIDIVEMTYDRNVNFDGKPVFEILTRNKKALEKLSVEMKIPLRKDYDERSWYNILNLNVNRCNVHIYNRKKF